MTNAEGATTKTNNDITSNITPIGDKIKHMMFEEGKRFLLMDGMENIPFFDNASKYVFFEPRPIDKPDDSTLEGCLAYQARVEQLVDKQNLYLCEMCTEDRFGKSKTTACLITPI